MRLSSSIARTLMRAVGPICLLAAGLVGIVTVTDAAAAPAASVRSCHQRPSLARLLGKRHPIILSEAARAGLVDTCAVLQCGSGARDDSDDAVIQDDAPAARIDLNDRVVPILEPIGTLTSHGPALPARRMLARRSPRGPPVFR
jgi:hypothetical protein